MVVRRWHRHRLVLGTVAALLTTSTCTTGGRFTWEVPSGSFFHTGPGPARRVGDDGESQQLGGRYQILPAANAIELGFDNGVVTRLFAFVPVKSGRLPRPKLLHLGGGDYLPE
mgnify:CR=1 FL=1